MTAPPDRRPRCPKCGEPARTVSGTAEVCAILEPDLRTGRVLFVSMKPAIGQPSTFRCGGGHAWVG